MKEKKIDEKWLMLLRKLRVLSIEFELVSENQREGGSLVNNRGEDWKFPCNFLLVALLLAYYMRNQRLSKLVSLN